MRDVVMEESERDQLVVQLESAGYRAKRHSAGRVVVSLPLFCSVNINIGPADFWRLTPRFGFVNRSSAVWLQLAIYLVFPPLTFALLGEGSYRLYIVAFQAYCFVLAAIWDGYRFVLTEGVMTRLSTIQTGIDPIVGMRSRDGRAVGRVDG